VGWCAPPQGPKAPRVWGGGAPPCLGGKFPPLHPLAAPLDGIYGWPPPPRGGNLGGGAAPSPPIYSGGIGAAQHMSFFSCWRSPTSLSPHISRCLAKPCWTTTLLHHHHAIVLLLDEVFPNLSLSPCWIKARETSSGCTCVEREGAVVRRLDRNQPRSESLRVRLLHPCSCNASS
jgi:hypothetical protein